MNPTVITYLVYLLISISLTVWVARTLFRNGRVFLLTVFRDREALADSVNHLLVVGFYLLNLGFVSLFLRLGYEVADTRASIEALSQKVGLVLLVLGAMHFGNLFLLSQIRMRERRDPGTDDGPGPGGIPESIDPVIHEDLTPREA